MSSSSEEAEPLVIVPRVRSYRAALPAADEHSRVCLLTCGDVALGVAAVRWYVVTREQAAPGAALGAVEEALAESPDATACVVYAVVARCVAEGAAPAGLPTLQLLPAALFDWATECLVAPLLGPDKQPRNCVDSVSYLEQQHGGRRPLLRLPLARDEVSAAWVARPVEVVASSSPRGRLARCTWSSRSISGYGPPLRIVKELRAKAPTAGRLAEALEGAAVPAVDVGAVDAALPMRLASRRRLGSRPFIPKVAESYDPWFLVDCALFTGHLRQVRGAGGAARDALVATLGDAAPYFLAYLDARGWRMPGRETLRSSRLRLDCAAMLYERVSFRHSLKKGVGTLVSSELLFDASRAFGREVLGIREIVLTFHPGTDAPAVEARRMPTPTLGHRRMMGQPTHVLLFSMPRD